MTRAPWWSDADRAELDALISELLSGVVEHRDRCPPANASGWTASLVLPSAKRSKPSSTGASDADSSRERSGIGDGTFSSV